ncbi:hypothetical protein BsWGS_06159 [Bradybaena similaris]
MISAVGVAHFTRFLHSLGPHACSVRLPLMSVSTDTPPSYNKSMQANQSKGYQSSHEAMGGMPAVALQPAGTVYPPQGGYPPPAGAVPSYNQSATNVIVQPPKSVITAGGCPACRVGAFERECTGCGIVCATVFFPCGILACLALRLRRCNNCGAVFG